MRIKYSKNNVTYTTERSDDHITLESKVEGSKHITLLSAKEDVTLLSAEDEFAFTMSKNSLYFLNGYQSWTDTKEYTLTEYQNNLDKIFSSMVEKFSLRSAGDQMFYDCKDFVLHGFDFGYIKGEAPLFIGNNNYQNAYLILEFFKFKHKIKLLSDVEGKLVHKGESFTVFHYTLSYEVEKAIKEFFGQLTPKSNRKLFGYTSWYNHYQNINETVILNALENADDRFELFQIDDGFEEFVGDWTSIDKQKFPNGLKPIVEKIHQKNMLAGIWLAPFGAEKNSKLVSEHPDWIQKDKNGSFLLAGGNWGGFYPLDLTQKEVVDHVKKVLAFYKDLGFDFFKLDFLYCANLSPISGKTRAESSEIAYSLLTEELQGKLILGCGATISNAFGKFDYMRIGPDVSLSFDDKFYMKFLHRERVSTKTTLQNTIYRSFLNGHAFLNDPDVFLLRDDNIQLTFEQRCALTTINSLFGSLFMTSDDPKTYDEEKRKVLTSALYNFRHAEVLGYRREKDNILVQYTLDGKQKEFKYDTKRGIIIHG